MWRGEEKKIPLSLMAFLYLSAFCFIIPHVFILDCYLLAPCHRFTICLNFYCFTLLSILLLSFLHAWRMIAERKAELDASLTELSFETCRRLCFAGVSCYSSLDRCHPKHQLSVTAKATGMGLRWWNYSGQQKCLHHHPYGAKPKCSYL